MFTPRATLSLFNTLLRTHHIKSRNKIYRVKRAATEHGLTLLVLRSGGAPGVMYAEARGAAGLGKWVAAVQGLRYKDFHCVYRPAEYVGAATEGRDGDGGVEGGLGFMEVESLAEFAQVMGRKGLVTWWRRGMGYEKGD